MILSLIKRLTSSQVAGNVFFLYLAHVGRYIFPLLLIPYLARVLETEAWGMYTLIQSFALYLLLFIEFGFGFSGTKEVSIHAGNKEELSNIFSSVLFGQIFLSFLAIILSGMFLLVADTFDDYRYVFSVAAIEAIIRGINFLWFFKGVQKMKLVMIIDLMTKLIPTILIFLIVDHAEDLALVFESYLIGSIVSLVLSTFLVRKYVRFKFPSFSAVREKLRKGLVLFWVRAGGLLMSSGTILVLGFHLSPVQLGIFAGAYKIIEAIRSLFVPIIEGFFPKLSKLVHDKSEKALRLIRLAMFVMSSFGLAMSVFVFLFAEQIIDIGLGPGYEQSVFILRVLAFFPFLVAFSQVLGAQWMVPIGLEKRFSSTIVFGGIFNLFLVLAMIFTNVHYQYIGFTFICSQLLILLMFARTLIRNDKFPFSSKFSFA